MEVKKGYKQTEVGVIPEDWKVQPLCNLTLRMTNGFVGPAVRHYTDNRDGVLYIQGYNVEEGSFNFHGIKYVTQEFHRANTKSCLRCGDVLTVQTGDVGLTTVVPESLAGANCHALIISRFDKSRVEPRFISYYLNSKPGRARMRLIETGTTMKHLNVGDMLQFIVPHPPTLAEQEAIAGALSDADAWIESLEQLIAKKRQIKQGAMQDLLTGKRRLPGFSGEWETKRFGDLGHFFSGGTPDTSNPDYYGGDIPWITSGDCNLGRIFDVSGRITHAGVLNSATKWISPGTVLMALYGATAGVVAISNIAATINQAVLAINLVNQNPTYMYQKLAMIKDWLITTYTQGGQPNLSGALVKAIEIKLPSLSEQTAISNILSDMDSKIESLELKLAKARDIKQGMMQALLTGRIRLV